jgi:hypothetical protein
VETFWVPSNSWSVAMPAWFGAAFVAVIAIAVPSYVVSRRPDLGPAPLDL